MARNTTSRESSMRENKTPRVFEEPNWLDIPDTVRNRFKSEGMSLRWLRITLKGQDDIQNIGKRLAEGWELVSQEEVPEMLMSSVVREEGRYAGAVCRGDLALAKMPLRKAQSRQRYYENQSKEMVEAVNQQLMGQSDSRMPIRNNSKSQVTTGRTPRFKD